MHATIYPEILFQVDQEKIKIDRSLLYLMTSYSGKYVLSRPAPYGYTFPYTGKLTGNHTRARLCCPVSRILYAVQTRLKKAMKPVLGKG